MSPTVGVAESRSHSSEPDADLDSGRAAVLLAPCPLAILVQPTCDLQRSERNGLGTHQQPASILAHMGTDRDLAATNRQDRVRGHRRGAKHCRPSRHSNAHLTASSGWEPMSSGWRTRDQWCSQATGSERQKPIRRAPSDIQSQHQQRHWSCQVPQLDGWSRSAVGPRIELTIAFGVGPRIKFEFDGRRLCHA